MAALPHGAAPAAPAAAPPGLPACPRHCGRRRPLGTCAAAALALALTAGACGQAPAPVATPPEPVADAALSLSDADRRFAIEAAGFARYQVEAARLAERRASQPMVKAFAALLQQQHGAALAELETLLLTRSVPWTGGIPAERRSVLDALESLAAVVFDRRFVEQVGIADHQTAVRLFESAVRQLQDPALRDWTERTLPVLQNHLASAHQIPIRLQARLPRPSAPPPA